MPTLSPAVPALALASLLLLAAPAAQAAPPTKEQCVDSHAKGQDAREAGQLSQATQLFLACAQPACPEIVRRDCARFADEVQRLQPTVSFGARDSQGDLPDTSVLVDGALLTSRLGDGKVYELDPGRREVGFLHAGKLVAVELVVTQGEKGRNVVAIFPDRPPPALPAPAGAPAAPLPPALPSAPSPGDDEPPARSSGPLVLAGIGAAAAVAGAVVLGAGWASVPSSCSLATHRCAAPPGDPMFATAQGGATLINVGAIVGGAGLATLGTSLLWYYAQPRPPARPPTTALSPWASPGAAGLTLSGRL